MFQFVYISTQSRSITTDISADILSVSRRNNDRAGVSGVLLQRGRRFLQVLEGERDAVMNAIARIRSDPRHMAIVALSERQLAKPEFGNWAMASDRDMPADAVVAKIDMLTRDAAPNVRAQFMSYATMPIAG